MKFSTGNKNRNKPPSKPSTKITQLADDPIPIISTIKPDTILDNIFKILGKPPNLDLRCPSLTRATPINQHEFRVNIYCDKRLTDTFFVKVNENGEIIKSDPILKKKYDE